MATSLITHSYKYNAAENFLETFSQGGVNGNFYYVFAGNHLPYANSTIPTIYDNVSNTVTDVYRNMVFGKLVQTTDVSLMIRRTEYETGTVYDMYDDKDPSLETKNFFVVVNDGGFYNVFKCLNNNNGAVSNSTPSISYIGTDGTYLADDKYTWKYMFTVDQTKFEKFSNDKYMPYTANTVVIENAIPGSIDAVKITTAGAGYGNYIESAPFQASDVNLFSNSQYYGISGATGASSTDDFYRGCIFGIVGGTGLGQYREILAYEGTSNTKYVVLDQPLDPLPDNSSIYSIYPGLIIVGDQTETVNAMAWAYVDPNGNTISRVEVIEPGEGYKVSFASSYAEYLLLESSGAARGLGTANVFAHTSVGVTSQAGVRPIVSPSSGHGSNPASELYASRAAISVKFTATESNTVPSTNQFRQIGVLLNPTFANVTINFTDSTVPFVAGDNVYSFYPKRIQNHINIEGGEISANASYGGSFDALLKIGDKVMIATSNSTNFIDTQLFTVQSVVNSSAVEFTTTSLYNFSNAQMYIVEPEAVGEVSVTSSGSIVISNVTGHVKDDAAIIGSLSGAVSNSITSLEISDIQKQFDTFVGTYRYTGTVTSGTFLENETITQVTDIVSNGVLHSVQTYGGTTNFYITNQNGIFNTSNTIVGSNSNAVATLTNKYLPEIVFGSGDVIYLENIDPIARANNHSEVFKLIFEF